MLPLAGLQLQGQQLPQPCLLSTYSPLHLGGAFVTLQDSTLKLSGLTQQQPLLVFWSPWIDLGVSSDVGYLCGLNHMEAGAEAILNVFLHTLLPGV